MCSPTNQPTFQEPFRKLTFFFLRLYLNQTYQGRIKRQELHLQGHSVLVAGNAEKAPTSTAVSFEDETTCLYWVSDERAGTSSADEPGESGRWQHSGAEAARKQETGEPRPALQSPCDPNLSTGVTPTGHRPQRPLLTDPPTLAPLAWSLGTETPQPHGVVLRSNTLMGECVGRMQGIQNRAPCGSPGMSPWAGQAHPSSKKLTLRPQDAFSGWPAPPSPAPRTVTSHSQGRRDGASC